MGVFTTGRSRGLSFRSRSIRPLPFGIRMPTQTFLGRTAKADCDRASDFVARSDHVGNVLSRRIATSVLAGPINQARRVDQPSCSDPSNNRRNRTLHPVPSIARRYALVLVAAGGIRLGSQPDPDGPLFELPSKRDGTRHRIAGSQSDPAAPLGDSTGVIRGKNIKLARLVAVTCDRSGTSRLQRVPP